MPQHVSAGKWPQPFLYDHLNPAVSPAIEAAPTPLASHNAKPQLISIKKQAPGVQERELDGSRTQQLESNNATKAPKARGCGVCPAKLDSFV